MVPSTHFSLTKFPFIMAQAKTELAIIYLLTPDRSNILHTGRKFLLVAYQAGYNSISYLLIHRRNLFLNNFVYLPTNYSIHVNALERIEASQEVCKLCVSCFD